MKTKKAETAEVEKQNETEGKVEEEKGRFHTESLVEYLSYTFSEEEKKDLGAKLAQCHAEHAEETGRLKSAQTQIKAEIARIDGEMTSLSEKIRSGKEYRNVKCEKVFDFRLGSVIYRRLDTGDVYRERPMDETERQTSMEFSSDETMEAAA